MNELQETIGRLKRSLNALEKAKFQNPDESSRTEIWYNLGVDFAIDLYKSDIQCCEFQIKLLS